MPDSTRQNYCTLFDSAFLSRGLALYESLKTHVTNFHLYVLAMDDTCAKLLNERSLSNLTVISLTEFETPALLRVKAERNRGEYCWTCTPFIIQYCLDHFSLGECTYLDSDIFFLANPQVLLDEIPHGKSVLITEHHYSPEYDQTRQSGRFCVQFVTFRNTVAGREILSTWAAQCLDWCYDRIEETRFGDQKYQDQWPTRWPDSVHILQHLGGGVAPWNIQQYRLEKNSSGLSISDNCGNTCAVIFYHFHQMKFLGIDKAWLGHYRLHKTVISLLYLPYLATIKRLATGLPVSLPLGPMGQPPIFLRRYGRMIKGLKPLPRNIIKV